MRMETVIIIIASIGFIIMGLVMLKSKKLKDILISSKLYKDVDKYINFTGKSNILLGGIGILLGTLDYIIDGASNYIVIALIVIILLLIIIQKVVGKKYKV